MKNKYPADIRGVVQAQMSSSAACAEAIREASGLPTSQIVSLARTAVLCSLIRASARASLAQRRNAAKGVVR